MKDSEKSFKLHDFIFAGKLEELKELLANEVNIIVDELSFLGVTPLLRAITVERPNLDIIKILLDYGSDLKKAFKRTSREYKQVFQLARNEETRQFLLEYFVKKILRTESLDQIFSEVIHSNDSSEVNLNDIENIDYKQRVLLLFCADVLEFGDVFQKIYESFKEEEFQNPIFFANENWLWVGNFLPITFEIEKISADGQCMYNAVLRGYARLFPEKEININQLRDEVAKQLEQNKEELVLQILQYVKSRDFKGLTPNLKQKLLNIFLEASVKKLDDETIMDMIRLNLVDEYIEAVRAGEIWGDNVEIGALNRILQVPIIIHYHNGRPLIIGEEDSFNAIHLQYRNNHYDLLYNIRIENIYQDELENSSTESACNELDASAVSVNATHPINDVLDQDPMDRLVDNVLGLLGLSQTNSDI